MTEHRRDNDAPSADKRLQAHQNRIANGVWNIENYQLSVQEDKPTLTSFTVKCDPDDEEGVLVIGKGYVGTDWQVCFHRDGDVTSALAGFGNRLRNGSLKWRKDEYA